MKIIKLLGLTAGLLIKALVPYVCYGVVLLTLFYIAYPQLFDLTWIKELLK